MYVYRYYDVRLQQTRMPRTLTVTPKTRRSDLLSFNMDTKELDGLYGCLCWSNVAQLNLSRIARDLGMRFQKALVLV